MDRVSRTALGVGILRAAHRLVDAEPYVTDDVVSLALFGDAARAANANDPDRVSDDARKKLRGHVLVRSAFAEGRFAAAVARGVAQCVILGAGFETFAWRQPAWMDAVRIYEVDAPETQRDKRERLSRAGFSEPPNLSFVPVDFETQTLAAALATAGFDARRPACFSWLGVTMYLTRAANDGVFAFVASLPAGSEIAFTFSERPTSDRRLAAAVAALGEPFVTHYDGDELAPMLRAHGFRDVAVLTIDETRALLGARRDDLDVPARRALASAIV